jgi:hypothetical protein
LTHPTVKVRALQSLHGRLQWASRVIFGGKAFMRALSDTLVGRSHPGHHARVSAELKADLRWWLAHAASHNGMIRLSPQVISHHVYTDACLAPVPCVGVFHAGAFVAFDAPQLVAMGLDPPVTYADNINVWECFAVYLALSTFPDVFATSRVVVHCDNASTVAWISGGSPKSLPARPLIQRLLALCVQLHVRLAVVPIEAIS